MIYGELHCANGNFLSGLRCEILANDATITIEIFVDIVYNDIRSNV